ncbi:MAG: DUF4369 domain-containing protein [Saprospiraceae bacterium]|nr:DUF4369 domain-containing protein [Saprospiraceae bacterium]
MPSLHFFIVTAVYFSIHVSCSAPGENKFAIHGEINGIVDSTHVMLQNLRTGQYLDSCYVISNKFDFTGELKNEPEELRIISSLEEMKKGNFFYTDLLIGNENITLEAHLEDLPYNVSTSGSATQSEADRYHQDSSSGILKWTGSRNRFHS